MLSIAEGLLHLLLIIGTSAWGWLGVVLGLGASFLSWELMSSSGMRGPVSAVVFVLVFMVCAWQELRHGKRQ
jgi:uncharacterized membrane protein YhhN